MSCPHCKKINEEVVKESKDDDDEQQVNAAFEANAF
jgi:phage FluMu protein Com